MLKGDTEGKRLWRFIMWLRSEVKQRNVGFLTYEDVRFQSTQAQTRLWSGWLTCVLLVGEFEKIPVKGFATNTVKLTASGKKRMQYAAKSLFNTKILPEENEADALCTLYTAELWADGKLLVDVPKKSRRQTSKKKDPQGVLL